MHDPNASPPSFNEQLRRALPRRPHVLLVLKDEVYATAISVWLSRLGWSVTHVAETARALESWRESGAAVALIDIDDDGLGALAVLAAATAYRPLGRAVICTRERALAELPEDVKRQLGIAEVAVRPCHVAVLGASILRAAGLSTTSTRSDLVRETLQPETEREIQRDARREAEAELPPGGRSGLVRTS
jgi:DNA-binding NtrC family response regulator